MSKVIYEGWMVRYGRRKIGRSFIHRRYFVLEPRLLAYYKKKPQDNRVITSSSSSSLLSEFFNVFEKKKEELT
jgi:hypothetical protein